MPANYRPGDLVRRADPYWSDIPETGTVKTPEPGDDPEPRCLGKVTPGRYVLVEWPAHPDHPRHGDISGARFWERADVLRPAVKA